MSGGCGTLAADEALFTLNQVVVGGAVSNSGTFLCMGSYDSPASLALRMALVRSATWSLAKMFET